MKALFSYNNYRLFLKDFYTEKKAATGYTMRDFSQAAGINSNSWLLDLIEGRKNLSPASMAKVTRALQLAGEESDYFEWLVHFTQAKDSDSRDYYYRKMIAVRKKRIPTVMDDAAYEYCSRWYHPIIRSLVSKVDWKDNYYQLARAVLPPITPSQAKKSVLLLQHLGLISRNQDGTWTQTDSIISTGDEVNSPNVINYHKQVSKLIAGVYDRCQRDERDISALILGIGQEEFAEIKTKIQQFRKEILAIARHTPDADQVYQFNLQFFPASKRTKRHEKR